MKHILLLACTPFLLAFTFSPMSQSIELGEKQKAAQFLLENTTKQSLAVEFTVKARAMDEAGVETQTDTKDLSVFPPQMIIPAGEKRTIRVNWNGKPELETEKNYRVIAEQLGLKVDDKTKNRSGIQMLMKYVAALYITPDNVKSDVSILSHTTDGKLMTLTLENKGQKHQILGDPVISYGKEKLKASDLPGLAGENILAQSKRTFKVVSTKKIPSDAKLTLKVND